MIIENVLGTFEINEKKMTIKAISFEKDFEQVLADIGQNRYNSTDLPLLFGGLMNADEIGMLKCLVGEFRTGREFNYTKVKSRFLVDLSWLLDTGTTVDESDYCHVINYGPLRHKKYRIGYIMPRDAVGLYDAIKFNRLTSLDCLDIFNYAQCISVNGSENSEFKHMIKSVNVKVEVNTKNLESISKSLTTLLELSAKLEEMTSMSELNKSDLKRLKDTIKESTQKHQKALEPLLLFLHTKVRKNNQKNSLDHLPPLTFWNERKLKHLHHELIDEKFISSDTSEDDFQYTFGFTAGRVKNNEIWWIKTTNNKISKISLFDLLQQMGYRTPKHFKPSLLNANFRFPRLDNASKDPGPIVGQDWGNKKRFETDIIEEHHEALRCIVQRCREK